jgi:nitrate/nitrite-specific signal transduction histidine kinase
VKPSRGPNAPNATKEDLDQLKQEWEDEQRPKRDPKGDWDRRKRDVKDWLTSHQTDIIVTAVGVAVVGTGIIIATGGVGAGVVVVLVF